MFILVPDPSHFLPFTISVLLSHEFVPGTTVVTEVELLVPPPASSGPPVPKSVFVKNSTCGNCCGLPQAGVVVSSNKEPSIGVFPSTPIKCCSIFITKSKLYS